MKAMDKKTRKKIVGGTALVLVVALLAAMPLIAGGGAAGGNKQSILSAAVTRGDIEKRLLLHGSLSSGDTKSVSVPENVRVTRLLVSNGDVVHKGDALAAVDKVSVMSVITSLRSEMQSLESQMYLLKFSMRDGAVSVGDDGRIYVGGSAINTGEYETYAEFLTLSDTHREYEGKLAELFSMYSSGALTAPCDGIISGIDKSVVTKLSDNGGRSGEITLLSSSAPDVGGIVLLSGDTYAGSDDTGAPRPAEPQPDTAFVVAKVIAVAGDTAYLVYDPTPQTDAAAPVIDEAKMTAMESVSGKYNVGDILLVSKAGITVFRPGTETPDAGNMGGGFASGFGGGGGGMGGAPSDSAGGSQAEDSYDMEAVTVMTIIPQSDISLILTVDEHDISALRVGTVLDVTVDAIEGKTFTGIVSRIDSSAENDGGSSKLTVELELEVTDEMLPGMNACASLVRQASSDCLNIPVAAVYKDSNGYFVYTAGSGDKLSGRVSVEVGLSDGENVEILSGLSKGDTVWYGYYDTLEISNKAK